jgi:two-component system, LytTR family, sensor kinase
MANAETNTPATRFAADLREVVVRCALYILLWLLVTLQFAIFWALSDAVRGRFVWPWEDYWRWSFTEWTTLAMLGPLAFWAAARKPIEPPHRVPRFLLHLLASFGFAMVGIVLGAFIALHMEPGRPEFGEQLEQFSTKHGEAGFLAYWVLVMVRQAAYLQREKNRRELQATRLEAQLAQSRLQVLKMQLHPHFLFNTLHAISTLIRDDAAAAEDMLLRLSELLRTYLEDDDRHEVTLKRELELIDLYLGIQRMRFKDRLTTRIDIADDTVDCMVPALILQPLVENAIQHGIGKHVGNDSIEIDCYREPATLCIDVRNRNGKLAPLGDESLRPGIGLSNSRLRLKELYGDGAQIRLDAMQPRGVICRLRLPYRSLAAPASSPRRRAQVPAP